MATAVSHNEMSNKKRIESIRRAGGFDWSEEKKEIARKAASGRMKRIQDQDGNIYESIIDASKRTGCQRSCIQCILRGKQKTTKDKDGRKMSFKQLVK